MKRLTLIPIIFMVGCACMPIWPATKTHPISAFVVTKHSDEMEEIADQASKETDAHFAQECKEHPSLYYCEFIGTK